MNKKKTFSQSIIYTSVIAAVAVLAGCGGGSSGASTSATSTNATMLKGVVAATAFTPGSATTTPGAGIAPSYWQGALVCVDANNNGKCDASENPVTTSSTGAFSLPVNSTAAIIADIGTSATNTATGAKNTTRNVYRASLDQVNDQGSSIVLSPLSTEVVRMMEANSTDYQTEKQNLATRLSVPLSQVLSDVNTISGANQTAMLNEANMLNNRFAYAITKLDRGDKYPDALAVPGGDPELTGMSGVTAATATTVDTRKAITFQQAEQAVFDIEGIPRYDSIFIVMLENKGTKTILNSAYAPKINAYLTAGNQSTSYYATGNPSEPNYTALGGADDFGIADDNQWNCNATGANAPTDAFLPTNTAPGLASSPFLPTATASCGTSGTNHNVVGQPNLFNAITNAGMTWRTYNESMNPGQDIRTDSVADPAVTALDNVYAIGTIGGNTSVVGDPNLVLPLPAGLYKTKHNPGMAFQNVRNAPEFIYSNRTMGGGQWTNALKDSTKYTIPAGYDYDQFGTDLASGNVGNLNFVMPDQCDDMHSITVTGTDNGVAGTASDCSGSNIITRGDNYVDYTIKKIEASPLWNNPQKKVAIVLMFDEGTATSGFNGAAGWNPGNSTVANLLVQNSDGTWSPNTSVNPQANYTLGNRGHGESIYGVLTNQASAPKGVADSDAYSHFSFVRTLQDMFGLSDPAKDDSYMGRSKYTEKFIAQNILNLPEYAGSADTHFDSVRPMNHAYVIPAGYTEKQSSDVTTAAQVGPDASQANIWAVK
ncbi:MAG: alkaline phosphatase family protein [Gallionella sp.]